MQTYELRRHSIKDGPTSDMIGPRGYQLARDVGGSQLRGKAFTHFFCSNRWRTHQTLAAFAEGAGDMVIRNTPTMPPFYGDPGQLESIFLACRMANEEQGDDLVQIALSQGELARQAARGSASLFREWATTLPVNAHVLIVGHSPSMELLLLGLKGTVPRGLKPCQGFRLRYRFDFVDSVQYATGDLDAVPRTIVRSDSSAG